MFKQNKKRLVCLIADATTFMSVVDISISKEWVNNNKKSLLTKISNTGNV